MKRRTFIGAASALMAGAYALPAASKDEESDIRRAVEGVYAAYRSKDKASYRALLTEDYLLLENGELLDVDGDLAYMAGPGSVYQRTDAFDFRSVKVQGETAWAVYFLTSDIADEKGSRHRKYLESMVLRRNGSGWRTALLHSTLVKNPE